MENITIFVGSLGKDGNLCLLFFFVQNSDPDD